MCSSKSWASRSSVRMSITFGRSGVWTIRAGGPQPAASKQTATNASTVERICRRGLVRLVVARPMRGRLYPLTGQVFIEERDWERFHFPKNLAMALSVEVAEIPGKALPEKLLTTFSREIA